MKTFSVPLHWNRLNETVLMMGNNICFDGKIWIIIPELPLLIWNTGPIFIRSYTIMVSYPGTVAILTGWMDG